MDSSVVMNLVLWPSSDTYIADGGSAYVHCNKGQVLKVFVYASQGNLGLDDGFCWFSGALVAVDKSKGNCDCKCD